MPVTVRRSPFRDVPPGAGAAPASLPPAVPPKPRPTWPRQPQLDTLEVMMPPDPARPAYSWPLFTRAVLRTRCGLSPTNSMNRILHGIREGPHAHAGLVDGGLVEEVVLDIEGRLESNYRITQRGVDLCLSLRAGAGPR